jgi:8-oxo-dGTP pyrophosphatase MutT (NUDIX family)
MEMIAMRKATFYYKQLNAPVPNKPNHIGSTILIKYDGKVLLESRKDSDRWAFIGGGLFLNETLLECVKRETLEETGIILSDEDIKFCKLYDDPSIIIAYPDGNVIRSIMALYTTTLKKMPDLKCSEESTELKFFSREELKEIKIVETHTPILADYFM